MHVTDKSPTPNSVRFVCTPGQNRANRGWNEKEKKGRIARFLAFL